MSEPTRDDLRADRRRPGSLNPRWLHPVTDEELEPIHLAWLREKVNPTCPECLNTGYRVTEERYNKVPPCPRCGGRGRLGVDLGRLRGSEWDTGDLLAAARALLDLLGEEE